MHSICWGTRALVFAMALALVATGAEAQKKPAEPAKKTEAKSKTPAKTSSKAKAKKAAKKKPAKPAAKKTAKTAPAKRSAAKAKSASSKKQSVCVGLSKAQCGRNKACTWRDFKKAKDKAGRKLTDHCRLAASGGKTPAKKAAAKKAKKPAAKRTAKPKS